MAHEILDHRLTPIRAWPSLRTTVELFKPLTWFAPVWAFGCGAVSAGGHAHGRAPFIVGGLILAGPLVCGTSQAVNDWFDRHVDAINEPDRPVPSGRAPGRSALWLAMIGTGVSLLAAAVLGAWVLAAAVVALALAWAYSAPPLRLKMDGWLGPAAVAACYEGLPWITGAVVAAGAAPGGKILALAALYSVGAHGIMTLNDFKAIEGDRRMGVRSLPVRLGVDPAVRLACLVMALAQLAAAGLLAWWGRPLFAAGIDALLLVQILLMRRLLDAPREKAPWYNGTGTTLYVLGMLVAAFAVRGL